MEQHGKSQEEDGDPDKRWKRVMEHVLFPAFKRKLNPVKVCAEDYTFAQIANLPDLYKVFERC